MLLAYKILSDASLHCCKPLHDKKVTIASFFIKDFYDSKNWERKNKSQRCFRDSCMRA